MCLEKRKLSGGKFFIFDIYHKAGVKALYPEIKTTGASKQNEMEALSPTKGPNNIQGPTWTGLKDEMLKVFWSADLNKKRKIFLRWD